MHEAASIRSTLLTAETRRTVSARLLLFRSLKIDLIVDNFQHLPEQVGGSIGLCVVHGGDDRFCVVPGIIVCRMPGYEVCYCTFDEAAAVLAIRITTGKNFQAI